MASDGRTAGERARGLITKLVEQALGGGADRRLPTVSSMAAMANVSPVTMTRVLARFREDGVLDIRQRAGIRVLAGASVGGQEERPAGRDAHRGTKCGRLCRRLRADLVTGMLCSGERMPSVKELAARYGAGHRTVAKALRTLCEEGTVVQRGREYLTGLRRGGGSRSTIVLIARGNDLGDLDTVSVRTQDQLRILEGLCARAAVRLETVSCHYIGTTLLGQDKVRNYMADQSRHDGVLGFLVWSMALDAPFLEGLMGMLAGYGRPVALLDEHLGPSFDSRLLVGLARIFRMATDREPGRHVAQYLQGLGHTRVAYVDSEGRERWSALRLAGLREGFAGAGMDNAVTRIVVPRPAGESSPEAPDANRLAIVQALMPNEPARLPDPHSVRERIGSSLLQQVNAAIARQSRRERLFPVLKDLLRREEITAWVCANDSIATDCLDFLRIESVPLPQRLSVMGFDDSTEAFIHKLSSYNFNSQAIIHAAFSHLVNQAPGLWASLGGRVVTVKGYVTERATSGPPGR